MKETNMEHFRSEIKEIINDGGCLALKEGVPVRCGDIMCFDCEFSMCHERAKIRWAMSEYKPEPVLTEKEMRFMEFVQRGWLARDADGDLFWHGGKPEKNFDSWHNFEMKYSKVNSYDGEIFHFITWEDESAWSVEELRKLKVK